VSFRRNLSFLGLVKQVAPLVGVKSEVRLEEAEADFPAIFPAFLQRADHEIFQVREVLKPKLLALHVTDSFERAQDPRKPADFERFARREE